MCVVACKYLKDIGWVIAKNRDRNYKPTIIIRKSFRRNTERLYIWDDRTKYTEGINEFGVAIISASVTVKEDEAEGQAAVNKNKLDKKTKIKNRTYYAPDGLRIRTALFERTAVEAASQLIELEIPGNTIIADRERCFLLEGAFVENDEYVYKIVEVPKEKIAVRTNHGIFLPWTGYSKEIPEQVPKRESSDARYEKVVSLLKRASTFDEFLDAMSDTSDENPQLNPLRIDPERNSMRTTGQLIMVPKEQTLHYRPIWCETEFDLDKLNTEEERTFFEIISTRKLLSFKDFTK
jgi:hypothetical protein